MRIAKETRRKINFILPVIVVLLSVAVILGWQFGLDRLRDWGSPAAATKPITAILFLLISSSALMLRCFDSVVHRTTSLLLSKFALLVIYTVVVLETLLMTRYWDYVLGFQLYESSVHKNIWPSIAILGNCTVLAIANIYRTILKTSGLFTWAGITVMFGGMVGLLGHILEQPVLYQLRSQVMSIGIPTCIMMMLMGINTAVLFKSYSQDEI